MSIQHCDECKKSILVAYFLWLFGGVFGLHHVYLHRDRQAFVWWSTLGGGFGIGWLWDLFYIPSYVLDVNDDPEYRKKFFEVLKKNAKPPFSAIRFMGMTMLAYIWGQLYEMAIPQDEFWNVNWLFLKWLTPVPVALGVWAVGNIGKEEGSLWKALSAAYICVPLKYYIFDESVVLMIMVTASALIFDGFSKKWRQSPRPKTNTRKRIAVMSCCVTLYLSVWCSYIYFNGTITDSDGSTVPVHEAIHHFLTSPWWVDLQQSMWDTYLFAQHHGWYEVWRQIIDLSDLQGEQNAHKILGVGPGSSQQEITSAWRKLSKENHPDKVKNDSQRDEAQLRFMEIQKAYEVLSKNKNRRIRMNIKDNSEL